MPLVAGESLQSSGRKGNTILTMGEGSQIKEGKNSRSPLKGEKAKQKKRGEAGREGGGRLSIGMEEERVSVVNWKSKKKRNNLDGEGGKAAITTPSKFKREKRG